MHENFHTILAKQIPYINGKISGKDCCQKCFYVNVRNSSCVQSNHKSRTQKAMNYLQSAVKQAQTFRVGLTEMQIGGNRMILQCNENFRQRSQPGCGFWMTNVGLSWADEQRSGPATIAAEHFCNTVGFLWITCRCTSAVKLNVWYRGRIDASLTVQLP